MPTAVLHTHLLAALILFGLLLWGRSARWRAVSAVIALVVLATGLYNFATGMKSTVPGWHAMAGIKALLGLHVIAIVFLTARGTAPEEKVARWRKGALISGTITLLIGLYLSNFAGRM